MLPALDVDIHPGIGLGTFDIGTSPHAVVFHSDAMQELPFGMC